MIAGIVAGIGIALCAGAGGYLVWRTRHAAQARAQNKLIGEELASGRMGSSVMNPIFAPATVVQTNALYSVNADDHAETTKAS